MEEDTGGDVCGEETAMTIKIKGLDEKDLDALRTFLLIHKETTQQNAMVDRLNHNLSRIRRDSPVFKIEENLCLYADNAFFKDLISALERLRGRLREKLDGITLTLETGRSQGGDHDD